MAIVRFDLWNYFVFRRFSAARRALVAVFSPLVLLAALPTSATAFVVDSQSATTAVGTCTLRAEGTYEDDHFYYGLSISGPGGGRQTFITNDGVNGSSVFSPAWIASTCGVTDVLVSTDIRANPTVSFADHSELWLSFQYTDPDDGLVHYATAAVQGRTGTTVFATNTTTAPTPTEVSFSFSTPPQTLPAAVTFTDTTPQLADRIVISRFWDFGDGNISTAANPTHSFAGYYTFTVELTICDTYGCDTDIQSLPPIEPDTTAPTITLSGLPAIVSTLDPINLTVVFDEDVTGFDPADVAISGATVTSLTGGPASYTLVITPTGAAAISVQIPAGVAADGASNPNEASNVQTATNALAGNTSELISSFMQARARNLIASQPSLLGVIRGGGHFSAEITSGTGVFDFSSDMARNLWFQLRGNWSTAGTQSDQYVFGAIGTHYQPSENLWLGMMAQFDDARSVDGVAETAGWGWLVGPYIVAQHPEQPLYFEASALYGQSYNTVSPLGTYSDDFTTTRLLATARVTGEYDTGRAVLFPNIGLVYTSDLQHAYSDSLANVIGAQSISMTDFSAGVDFELPLSVSAGQLTLTGGAAAHFTAVGGDAVGVSPYEGFSASTALGLAYATPGGARYAGSARYDGIGNSGYEAYGVTFEMSLPF